MKTGYERLMAPDGVSAGAPPAYVALADAVRKLIEGKRGNETGRTLLARLIYLERTAEQLGIVSRRERTT
jgi:hypothetical protein